MIPYKRLITVYTVVSTKEFSIELFPFKETICIHIFPPLFNERASDLRKFSYKERFDNAKHNSI